MYENVDSWCSGRAYVAGEKANYNSNIYEAKWWTQGDVPSNVEFGPWKLIHEVIPEQPKAWDCHKTYIVGGRVIYNCHLYEAKWWTQGEAPGNENGPWKCLGKVTPDQTAQPIPSSVPVPSGELPKRVLTGYWQNWSGEKTLKISDVPHTYNLICVSFAQPTSTPGEVAFQLDSGLSAALGGYTEAQFISDIAAAKGKGQRVILSVGGEVGTVKVENESQATTFANSVRGLITKYGFAGVDIDLEHGINAQYMASALRKLSDQVGSSLIITMAPQTIDMQKTEDGYFKLALEIKDILTICNTQFYNSGSMLGYDGRAYSQGNADFLTALATIQLEKGLKPEQVGLGLPASVRGAGSGHIPPSVVTAAYKALVQGTNSGSFQAPRPYPALRGVMTWSINWDALNNYEFSNAIAACFSQFP